MPSNAEIRKQTAWELNRRTRLSVPAFAGGFLYLLSAIIITSTLNGLPTVVVQEGGYDLATLGGCVAEVLKGLRAA